VFLKSDLSICFLSLLGEVFVWDVALNAWYFSNSFP
jgi:hypothetical protein